MHISSGIGRIMISGYIGQHQSSVCRDSVPIGTATIHDDVAGCNNRNVEIAAGLQFPFPRDVIIGGEVCQDAVEHGRGIVCWRKGSGNVPIIGVKLG